MAQIHLEIKQGLKTKQEILHGFGGGGGGDLIVLSLKFDQLFFLFYIPFLYAKYFKSQQFVSFIMFTQTNYPIHLLLTPLYR